MNTCPTPPHTNPMQSGRGNTLAAQNQKKNQKLHDFRHQTGGGGCRFFFQHFGPPPKKSGLNGGGGGSGPKTHGGMRFLDKIMSLQRVKPPIRPLGVRYANRPKKGQNGGGMWRFPICMGLPRLRSNNLRHLEESAKQSANQSVRLSVGQAGRQKYPVCFRWWQSGLYMMVGKYSGRMEKQFADGQLSVGLSLGLDSPLHGGLSLSHFADQGSNPFCNKLLTPPPLYLHSSSRWCLV